MKELGAHAPVENGRIQADGEVFGKLGNWEWLPFRRNCSLVCENPYSFVAVLWENFEFVVRALGKRATGNFCVVFMI